METMLAYVAYWLLGVSVAVLLYGVAVALLQYFSLQKTFRALLPAERLLHGFAVSPGARGDLLVALIKRGWFGRPIPTNHSGGKYAVEQPVVFARYNNEAVIRANAKIEDISLAGDPLER